MKKQTMMAALVVAVAVIWLVRIGTQQPAIAASQIAFGFNAPAVDPADAATSRAVDLILRSEEAVRQSWLAAALDDEQLTDVLARADFSRQALIVLTMGRHVIASGYVSIVNIRYAPSGGPGQPRGYITTTRLGLIDTDTCNVPLADSYPFIVVAVEAASEMRLSTRVTLTFVDECGPIVSGTPVDGP